MALQLIHVSMPAPAPILAIATIKASEEELAVQHSAGNPKLPTSLATEHLKAQ